MQSFPKIQAFIFLALCQELVNQGVQRDFAIHCKIRGLYSNRFLSCHLAAYFNATDILKIVPLIKELSNSAQVRPNFAKTWAEICNKLTQGDLNEREQSALEEITKAKTGAAVNMSPASTTGGAKPPADEVIEPSVGLRQRHPSRAAASEPQPQEDRAPLPNKPAPSKVRLFFSSAKESLEDSWQFIKKHRRKFIIGGVGVLVLSGVVAACVFVPPLFGAISIGAFVAAKLNIATWAGCTLLISSPEILAVAGGIFTGIGSALWKGFSSCFSPRQSSRTDKAAVAEPIAKPEVSQFSDITLRTDARSTLIADPASAKKVDVSVADVSEAKEEWRKMSSASSSERNCVSRFFGTCIGPDISLFPKTQRSRTKYCEQVSLTPLLSHTFTYCSHVGWIRRFLLHQSVIARSEATWQSPMQQIATSLRSSQ